MSRAFWKPARSLSDLDESQRLRFHCIHSELGIRVAHRPHIERDVSSTDCLSSTEHVLVYDDAGCVATGRVAYPNPDIARASGTRFGLELEDAGVDLAALADISEELAEISRLFVLLRAHGTGAAARLYEGLYVLTRQRGARYWVGGVDCRTSILEEAELMRSVLARRGQVSTRYRLSAAPGTRRESRHGNVRAPSRFYTPEQLEHGNPEVLPIAGALTAFTKRLGAVCIGGPALHPKFPRYVLPLLVDLEQLPPATLRMFDHGQLAPLGIVSSSPRDADPVDAQRMAT